jgi:hypothetical protein
MSDGCRCPCARHLSMSKSLRATTAELDDLRVPLLGCTDQIVRAESAVGCCPSPGSSVLAGDLVLPPALVYSEGLIVLPGSRLARPAGSRREPRRCPMATTISSAALVPVTPVFSNTERLALAGWRTGGTAVPSRDPRIYMKTWRECAN